MPKQFSINMNLVSGFAVFTALCAALSAFPPPVNAGLQAVIVTWATWVLKFSSAITAGGTLFASSDKGPLVGAFSDTRKAVIALAGVGAALALCAPLPAKAQPLPPTRQLAASNPLNLLANWADADVKAAIAASTAYPGLQDQVGQACFTKISILAALIKAHPLPVSMHLATDVEYARLDQAALTELCREPACAQVWSDAANAVQALSVMPLPFSFSSLCAKVPVVGLSVPAPLAAPASAK